MIRKNNKIYQGWLALMTIAIMALTVGCSDEPNGLNYEQVTSARVDLSGAVSIGISQGKPESRAIEGEYLSAGMYKIDANGEIHAVAIYFTDKGQHEERLRVAPEAIENISDSYMLALGCDYYDSDNDLVQDLWIEKDGEDLVIRQDIPYKNLLIRKYDGKIWCIDDIMYYLIRHLNPLELEGYFKEDNFGNLYFAWSKGDYNIYKFNFSDITSSFEQLTYKAGFYNGDFHITDNGVFWTTQPWRENLNQIADGSPYFEDIVRITWPHKGSSTVQAPLIDDFPNKSPLLKGDTLILDYATKVECVKNIPVILCFPEYWIKDCSAPEKILNMLNGEIAHALCYTVKIGDNYDDAELNTDSRIVETEKANKTLIKWGSNVNDVPIVIRTHYRYNVLNVYNSYRAINGGISTFAYNNIILLNDGGDLAKIDIFNKTWNWLGVTCPFQFDTAEGYANKLWKCEKKDGKEGMTWFDLSSYESGFVPFDRELPNYMELKISIDQNGKRIYSGFNPATGQIETIEIDIQTGSSTSGSESPSYFLQSIINLN